MHAMYKTRITMFLRNRLLLSGLLCMVALAFNSCRDKIIETVTYTANVPIYKTKTLVRAGIQSTAAKQIEAAGKIHIRGKYIYLVDRYEGVHVIDNTSPAAPINAGYIAVPGVVDIASSGNILYADNYMDMVAIDITDPLNVSAVGRVNDVFEPILPPTGNNLPVADLDERKGIIVGWKVETVTEQQEVEDYGYYGWGSPLESTTGEFIAIDAANSGAQPMSAPTTLSGKSGSMARFTVFDNALYAVNNDAIVVFDITDQQNPVEGITAQTGRVVETLFPMDEKLFVGTTSGMLIYDLISPLSPQYISEFNHATNCDPVVVEGDYAYVTLRSGTQCGGWSNQLDVVDISNIQQPALVESYNLTNPHGLGIDNGTLFICDGSDGLKVYNADDPRAIDENMIAHFQEINTYDVIPLGEVLLMIGNDGLYQYDYSDPAQIRMLSVISTQ